MSDYLLRCLCVKDMYPGHVLLAQKYLENKVSSGGVSNYSLCLLTYALALANSPVAGTALTELSRRAEYRGNLIQVYWFRNMQKNVLYYLSHYYY